MSWSRREVLAGLSTAPLLACARRRSEREPPRVPSGAQISLPVIHELPSTEGPTLMLAEDHALPLVAMAIAIRAGHAHEPAAHPGLAGLAGAMLVDGMGGGSRRELLGRYGDLGTHPAVSKTRSRLVLGCVTHRDDAGAALSLMAENLRAPTMDQASFERRRREHGEWASVTRGEPATVTGLGLLTASLGVELPSTALGIGPPHGLDGLELETVRAFLRDRVRREDTVIMMAGDVDEARAWDWIERALGGWSSSAPLVEPSTTEPSPTAPTPTADAPARPLRSAAVLVPWPTLPQAFIALGGPRAPYGHEDEPGQTVATSLISSTLHYELRSKQRSTYSVQSRVWPTSLGDVQQIWVRVDPDATRRAVEAIGEQLAMLDTDLHFTEQIVAEIRQGAELDAMLSFHGPEATLRQLVRLADAELGPRTPQRRLEWLREVDALRVSKALLEVLGQDRRCWCVAGEPTAIEQASDRLSGEHRLTRTPEALLGLA